MILGKSKEVINMRLKAALFSILCMAGYAHGDTVVCRGAGCPPEATSVGLSTGITKAVAGGGISLSPASGIGEVTITNTLGAVGSAGNNIAGTTQVWMNGGQTNSFQVNSVTGAYQNKDGWVYVSSIQVAQTITSTSGFNGPHSGVGTNLLGISSVSAQSVNGDSLKSTNKATDGLVPKYDATSGGVTWSADNAGSGSAGAGTTSSTMVVIQGGTDGNAQNIISFQNPNSTTAYVDSVGNWRFGMVANQHLLIATNSWQSIGTTAPQVPLHVFPNSTSGNNSGVVAMFDSRGLNDGTNGRVVFQQPSSPSGGFRLDFGSPGSAITSMVYNQDITGSNPRYFSFNVGAQNNILSILGSRRIGVNTSVPDAVLHVTSAAGTNAPMLIVSTGTSKLFEVTGTSVSLPAQTYLGGLLLTTGVVSPALSGGTSDPLYVASGAVAHLTTTGTFKAQTVAATAYHTLGSGAGLMSSPSGEIQMDANGDLTVDWKFNTSSATVGGVKVSTDQANTPAALANKTIDAAINVISFRDQDRFTTPSFASGTFVTYIATPTMGISSSTLGHFQFNNAISSQANFAVFPWIPPSDIDLTANIILSSFGVILGGADTGTQRYILAISTTMDGRPARETMFSSPYSWLEGINVDVGADSAGVNGYLQVVGNTTLTSWQTRVIPGALHYITVMRDGDAAQDSSTIDSYSSFFSVSYKRRLTQ